jgi:hypothetical protein
MLDDVDQMERTTQDGSEKRVRKLEHALLRRDVR